MLDVIIDLVTEYSCDGSCLVGVDIVIASRPGGAGARGGGGGKGRCPKSIGTTNPQRREQIGNVVIVKLKDLFGVVQGSF